MNKICVLSIYFISLFIQSSLNAQYPYLPQNTQKYINGTIGEERGNRQRYHYGLDFAAPDETNVYAIETGPKRKKDNASFAVGTYGYIHVIATDAIDSLPNGSIIQAGTLIGTVQMGTGHVHLQRATENIYRGDPKARPHSWEDNTFTWINPLLGLSPLVDNAAPRIDDLILFREGGNQATDLSNTLGVFGKYDVLVNTEDQRINTDGTGNGYANAPNSMHYKLINTSNVDITSYTGFDFSNVPPNASANSTFGVNSSHDPANFEYLLTSNPFQTPYNRYLNLRQTNNEIFSTSTDIPILARYKDGTEFKIKARACDAALNCVYDSIPNNNLFFTIDNFQPFITDYKVKDGSTIRFHHNRLQSDPAGDNNGIINLDVPINNFSGTIPNTMAMEITTSEPLQSCTMYYRDKGITNWGSPYTMYGNTEKTIWTFYFNCGTGGKKEFSFQGLDMSGNTVMDVYNMTTQHTSSNDVNIPVRNSATTWTNLNTPQLNGQDYLDLAIECGREISGMRNDVIDPSRSNTLICESLKSVREYRNYNVSSCNVSIGLTGVNPVFFDVGWKNEAGNYILGEANRIVDKPGRYCYIVESRDGCCSKKGCIDIENMLDIDEPELITDCSGTHIDFKLDPSEYTIEWLIKDGNIFRPAPEYSNLFSI